MGERNRFYATNVKRTEYKLATKKYKCGVCGKGLGANQLMAKINLPLHQSIGECPNAYIQIIELDKKT